MPANREIRQFRDAIRGYVSRRNGLGVTELVTIADFGALAQAQDFLMDERFPLLDDNGRPIVIQNEDGSFVPMPGYDGPVS